MLRELYHQLLVYRSIVFPFLAVSAIAVPCWLAFRIYRVHASGRRISVYREVLLLIVVLYLSGLAPATLAPNHNPRLRNEPMAGIELRPSLTVLTCSAASLPSGSRERHFCMYNAKGNIALFFPLGLLIPLVWPRLRFWKGLQVAVALSVSIEIAQLFSRAWGSYRAADINDVVLNVVGASLGMALVFLLRSLRGSRSAVPQGVAS
jgi:glycopeptide antibiotics resistance protein